MDTVQRTPPTVLDPLYIKRKSNGPRTDPCGTPHSTSSGVDLDLRKIIGYFRTYLPNFARFARPLTDMTCNNMPNTLNWTEEHKRILDDALKQMLCDATKLHVAEYGKPYCILVDASKTAVGNCLFQWSDDGGERPVAFASCKLTASQQAWAAIEAETYAAIWSLRRYRNLIFGSKITC